MEGREKYQRIDLLEGEDDSQLHDCKIDRMAELHFDDHDVELYSPSPLSSTPPNEFEVNIDSQYVPIFDENDSPNQDSLSSASSLSVKEDTHDYATSPIILKNTRRVIRCPVCEKPMRTYYCAKCILKGEFVTLNKEPSVDPFTTARLKLFESRSNETSEESITADENKLLEDTLHVKLRSLTRKTEAFKTLYKDQKAKLEKTRDLLAETKLQVANEVKSCKSKENKIELMKRIIASRKASIKKRRDAELGLMDDLKQYVSRRVFQLTADVFPIEEINLSDQENSFVNMETSPLLTFSDGSHHQIEQQTAISIVGPYLPSDGDYSAYSLWVNDNRDHIPASMSELSEKNPAFRIGAGLAYTAQLVKNLASYLDVILPARVELDTFSRELMNDPQFSYNVAKLNANVIHLCISQGVDVSLLNPHRTLKNLMLLFNLNICDLGRKPIIDLDNEEAARRIEERLACDLSLIQENFYDFSKFGDDDDDTSDSEWEISDTINSMEMQMATEQSIQQNSYISRLPMRLFASFWSTGS